jgi:hypothetical protein
MAWVVVLLALPLAAQDLYMGDWEGTVKLEGKDPQPVAVYMIPLGGGRYEAKLVGEFGRRVPTLYQLRGKISKEEFAFVDAMPFDIGAVLKATEDGVVVSATLWKGVPANGEVKGTLSGKLKGTLSIKQTQRLSQTLGLAAPAGAVKLFDGKDLDQWASRNNANAAKGHWKLVDGGAFEVSGGGDLVTKERFGSHRLHLEFRTPYMAGASGQGRGNSGVYLQGRYEVQVLDSYGLEGADNECGGIYQVARPGANMAAPPLQWQTYDITFTKPEVDATGKKTANARLTVVHNGVTIHKDLELPRTTGGALDNKEGQPGPLLLQDHGNPVQYRNIWIQKLD